MSSIRRTYMRVAALFRGQVRADEELRAEMEAHLEMAIEENLRRGLAPEEARRQALLESGGLTQAAERVREQRGVPWIESLGADVRFAVRHFRRTPLSTATIILVLSLGLGTNIVLFTVLNSLMTMPAAGIERDASLVRIRGTASTRGTTSAGPRLLSWPEVQEYAGRTDLFSGVAAYADEVAVVNMGDMTTPATVSLIYTTSNYYEILKLQPVLGKEPAAESGGTQMATAPTALISNAMWQERFGARDVIGRTIRVNDFPVEISGVAPPHFTGTDGGSGMTVWVPLAAYPLFQKRSAAAFSSYDSMFLSAAARLRPGVTKEAAAAVVAGIAERAFDAHQGAAAALPAGAGATIAQRESASADVVPMLAGNSRVSGARMDQIISGAISGGLALLVLLITCTNVSALMVGLAVARRREIGVRLSLGAPRKRLIRQLLTESVLMAVVAAAAGLFATTAGIQLIGATLDGVQLVVDWRVTIATCTVAVVTGLLFGLSPALHATRVPVAEVLKGSSKASSGTRSRLQRGLVVAQIAFTQPLLVGLGVVIVTMATDVSSRANSPVPDRIAEIELDTWSGRMSAVERASRVAAMVERVGALPGVLAAMPMQMGTVTAPLTVHTDDRVAGITYPPAMEVSLTAAPKGYFDAFEIPFVRGRDFAAAEYAHAIDEVVRAPSFDRVIIGSDLARRLWGSADPLGRRLTMATRQGAGSSGMVVVGVVDAAAAGPSDVIGQIRVYVPYSQMNTGVIARTAGSASPMLNAMRKAVAAEAPHLRIVRAQTIAQREAEARQKLLRTSAAIATGGILALLLSAVGLYAVVSFGVGQRTREIGIRTALGAPQGQVARMFFIRGLALSAFGLLLGLPLSMLATRFISSRLNWPMASSPLIGIAIGTVVLAVASVAVWVPARRASTIDPLEALRAE